MTECRPFLPSLPPFNSSTTEGKKTECRPLRFLIGLPFALIALILSFVGAVIWVIGSVLSCLCPCCICCTGLANFAVALVKLPIKIIRWFTDQIPC